MLLSTRDAQRERRNSLILAAAVVSDRLSVLGIDNASFQGDAIIDLRAEDNNPNETSSEATPSIIQSLRDERDETASNSTKPAQKAKKRKYRWQMSHYFYIHMSLFILNGLFGGLIIYLIENHSSVRNEEMDVPYLDAWFVSCSCVYNCGLTTIDFGKLSHASQIVLMVLTFISGITISTLPALVIKAQTHKKITGLQVDDDHDKADDEEDEEEDALPTFNIPRRRYLPQEIRKKLATLPTAAQLRYRAYITCIVLTLGTCFAIYLIAFCAIGGWLAGQYQAEDLLQGNRTVNPWYISFIVTVTGFNQNGLTPFSTGFTRFVHDVYLNIFVMLVKKLLFFCFSSRMSDSFQLVMSGTSLFPFLLRNVVIFARWSVPWRHKVVFDYILINNHRLSTLLFPAVQTRTYLLITLLLYTLGVGISLILDLHRTEFEIYSPGTRVLIFFFHTVNSRFAGFNTVDMTSFAAATLMVYLMLMATKPQMLCAIDESPFEISWLAVQAQEAVVAKTGVASSSRRTSATSRPSQSNSIASASTGMVLPMKQMEMFLRRQSLVTKDRARKQFAQTTVINGIQTKPQNIRGLRLRLFLIYFVRALITNAFSFILLTRTWLFVFIFLICAIEYRRMAPVDPEITVFKVIFEIISAFGAVGLSLGYPNVASSFSSVLSPASKVILVVTMFMGRHRGLLASMKDQEVIELSAADTLHRRREELINAYEQRQIKRYCKWWRLLFNIELIDSNRENESFNDNMFGVDRNANKSPLLFSVIKTIDEQDRDSRRHHIPSGIIETLLLFCVTMTILWDDIPREDHFVLFFNDRICFLSVELLTKPEKYCWIGSADWTTAGWGKSKEETTQMVDRKNDRFSIGADENESFSFVSTSFYKQ